MSKPSALSTYARLVGEIAIAWNELELRLDALIFHYLSLEAPVAGFILGGMGNATKTELLTFLVKRFETEPTLVDCGLFSVALLNRLRDNRNIMEHASPFSWRERYDGTLWKTNRRGERVPYFASVLQLRELLKIMKLSVPYLRWLAFTLAMLDNAAFDRFTGGKQTGAAALQVLSLIERPLLPNKITPLQPLEVQTSD